jgi:hypothetical protein
MSASAIAILFVIVFYGLYIAFVGSVVWALWRRRGVASEAGHRSVFRLTALGMALLPIANAVWIVAALAHAESIALPLIATFFLLGATLLGVGLLPGRTSSSTSPLLLRLCGWSLIAGVALIPSFLVLLLPVPIALAFFVPEDYRRRGEALANA